jgi:GT2 family glycosyltransferase/glycosyltransferase involved in cell wall biosynthesis
MNALSSKYETFVLRCNSQYLTLEIFHDGNYIKLESYFLESAIEPVSHRNPEYDDVVGRWLIQYSFDLVHIRHIGWHSLGLLDVSKLLKIPTAFSFHDFYTICPTVKLLDNEMKYCGGHCTGTNGNCTPELWGEEEIPPLKNAWVYQWQRNFSEALEKCDAFITTTFAAKSIITETYVSTTNKPFHVIPHGRDFTHFNYSYDKLHSDEALRVLIPGNIGPAKGMNQIIELSEHAVKNNFEIHLLGAVSGKLRRIAENGKLPNLILHGAYNREDFPKLVSKINPHIGAVLSIWPETFCHTLTELWASGLPVIGFEIGAVGDRINDTSAGWLAEDLTSASVLNIIKAIRNNPEEITEKRKAVKKWQCQATEKSNTSSMGKEYKKVYNDIFLSSLATKKAHAKEITAIKIGKEVLVITAIDEWAGNKGNLSHVQQYLENIIPHCDFYIKNVDNNEVKKKIVGSNNLDFIIVRSNGECNLSNQNFNELQKISHKTSIIIEFTPDWSIKGKSVAENLEELMGISDFAIFPKTPEPHEIQLLANLTKKRIYLDKLLTREITNHANNEDHLTRLDINNSLEKISNETMIDWNISAHNINKGKISIIIPVLNNLDITKSCIESIQKFTKQPNFEIIVVNNGSSDDTSDGLSIFCSNYKNIKLVKLNRNMMFSVGCNIGASHSDGEIIVFLNNDTEIISGNWLFELVQPLHDDSNIAIVGCKLLYPDNSVQHAGIAFGSDSKFPYHIFSGFSRNHIGVTEERNMSAVTGACMAMRNSEFKTLKGFDPIYINGSEDIDFCFKARKILNKKILYKPSVEIIHHEGKSEGRGGLQRIKNRRIFVNRWGSEIIQDDIEIYNRSNINLRGYNIKDKNIEPNIRGLTPIFEDKKPQHREKLS